MSPAPPSIDHLLAQLQICLRALDVLGFHAAAAHVDSAIYSLHNNSDLEEKTSKIDIDWSVYYTYLDEIIDVLFHQQLGSGISHGGDIWG